MRFGYSPLLSFKSLTGSGLRLGLTLVIVLIVISSPIFTLVNPAALAKTDHVPTISTIPSAPSTIGQNGKDGDFTTQALSSLTARPTNNIVNTNSFYDIVFVTATSGAIKSIQVTFPAGTAVPTSASFNEAEGIGPGTVSKSGQTLTYTVTNAVNVPAGTKIRLEFANINNPLSPSANYKVTVTTRNAANTVIDGPTQSAVYAIKQIGANAIADGAVTAEKIANNAIQPDFYTINGPTVTVTAGNVVSGDAFCLSGDTAVGGGLSVVEGFGYLILTDEELTVGGNAYRVEMYNSHSSTAFTFQPEVNCMIAFP